MSRPRGCFVETSCRISYNYNQERSVCTQGHREFKLPAHKTSTPIHLLRRTLSASHAAAEEIATCAGQLASPSQSDYMPRFRSNKAILELPLGFFFGIHARYIFACDMPVGLGARAEISGSQAGFALPLRHMSCNDLEDNF